MRALLPLLALGAGSCSAVPSGPPSLHLLRADVSAMEEVPSPKNMRQWESADADALRAFDAIQLERVDVAFSGASGPLSAIDEARIEATVRERVELRLREAGVPVVPGAGPGVMRVQLRLAGLRYGDAVKRGTSGEMLRRQIRLQGFGIEGQFRDGESGRLGAVILTRPRGVTSVAERWSEMEDVLDLFARNFAREAAAIRKARR